MCRKYLAQFRVISWIAFPFFDQHTIHDITPTDTKPNGQ